MVPPARIGSTATGAGLLEPGGRRGNLVLMRRISSEPDRPGLLPYGQQAIRRAGGFALLGCSLWLVSLLALVRSVMGLFH
jgi:hypothetical protein